MNKDATLYQTAGEQMRAEEMSRVPTTPPAQIPGYRIDRLIGRGAFGQVWIAVDRNTGREVAIKFYTHHSQMDWKLLTREVRHLVSMAADRNIVQVLAVGWEHDPPYYVMEYLENGSLDDLIRQRERLPVAEALPIFRGILSAMSHSHGRGILHCDLKPANILLDPQMGPRLADFGQSRMSNEQSPSLGTLFYMAPEQADLSAMPDVRWDVYALGAILYCMLVGHPPHYSSDTVTTLHSSRDLEQRLSKYQSLIKVAPEPRLHHRVKGIGNSLEQIIDRMLQTDPAKRYDNIQQVVDALRRREQNRTRRPLLLLGVVGPLLLMTVMSLLFWRGVSTAKMQTTYRLQQEAKRSNNFAASLAARTMERDIASLYQLVEEQAAKLPLENHLLQFNAELATAQRQKLVAISPPAEMFETLLASPARADLQQHLEFVLQQRILEKQQFGQAEQLNSLFVLDTFGTIIATAFAEPLEKNKVGWNFAYRSYYNGRDEDFAPGIDRSDMRPSLLTHLSPPFKSTTTNRWKIAISTPIFKPQVEVEKANEHNAQHDVAPETKDLVGVLVMTINLGDFDLLGNAATGEANVARDSSNSSSKAAVGEIYKPATDRFAVLIDGRPGPRQGTMVQHPLLSQLTDPKSLIALPNNRGLQLDATFRIDATQLQQLLNGGMFQYRDPLAQHPLGQAYAGDWIASLETIQLPRRGEARLQQVPQPPSSNQELLVLVQEPATATSGPVQTLVNAMTREFLVALSVIFAVVGSLWFFGLRMLKLAGVSIFES